MARAAVLDVSPEQWRELAVAVIAQYAEHGLPFTADDVRLHLEEPPHSPNAWGAAFATARARGIIRRTGYTTSERISRRHSAQAVWLGAQYLF